MGRPRSKPIEELNIIHTGATISDLASIFGGSARDVQKKIIGRVAPSTPPDEYPIRYRIGDVAPFLVNPANVNLEDVIKGLTPAKLPPMLQDAFWKAQRNRQNFEVEQGHLWSTERVVEVLGNAFKPLRMALMMFKSEVASRTELSPLQRTIIEQMTDSALETLHDELIKQFEDYVPPDDEHGTPLTDGGSVLDIADTPDYDDGFGSPDEPSLDREEPVNAGFDDGFG